MFSAFGYVKADGKTITIDPIGNTKIELKGTIIGPIQWGSKEEGDFFKAYHVRLNSPVVLNDNDACGEQESVSLPINQEGMDKFKGKKVILNATVFCQSEKTGKYHLTDVSIK